jgi:hypothetical protein
VIKTSPPDEQGNFFQVEEKNGWLTVKLKLGKESALRLIGKVDLRRGILELKRSKEKHLFRKNDSYGFNEYFIRTAKTFNQIELTDEDGTYIFPKDLVLQKGSYLHFKGLGFERQLFLPLSEIKKYKSDTLF